MLGETSEAAALNEARHTDGRAAAALNITACLGSNRVVCVQPDRSGAQGHRRLRRLLALAALRDKCVVHLDVIHVPGPDQKRIGCVRGALIAVASAFDNQTQTILAGEVYGRRDVVCISRGHGINTRLGSPCIRPTQRLRQARLVADVEGVVQILEDILTSGALGGVLARSQRKLHWDEVSANLLLQLLPARGTRPGWVGRPHAASGRLGWSGGPYKRPIRPQARQQRYCSQVL